MQQTSTKRSSHDKLEKGISLELCKKFQYTAKWYKHESEYVVDN